MQNTNIEWVVNPDGSRPGWTSNPMTGCENHVKGLCKGGGFPCYAYRLANGRLRNRYLANTECVGRDRQTRDLMIADPFYYRFWPERMEELHNRNRGIHRGLAPKERGIFMCDMGDLFGDGVPEQWQAEVLDSIDLNKGWDRFYLLTKQPQNLIKWSPFPDNCWVGVTVTTEELWDKAVLYLHNIKATVKYLSLEPCMFVPRDIEFILKVQGQGDWRVADWLIIGGCTGTQNELSGLRKKYPHLHLIPYGKKWVLSPPIEHIEELVRAADKVGIPVFLKDNLQPLYCRTYDKSGNKYELRQEWPKG